MLLFTIRLISFDAEHDFPADRSTTCNEYFLPVEPTEAMNVKYCSNSDMFGRLGNRIALVRNMLYFAYINGCDVRINGRILDSWEPKFSTFARNPALKEDPQERFGVVEFRERQDCGEKSGQDWYFMQESIKTTLESAPATNCSVSATALKHYFEVNRTHALGARCEETTTFAVHVRSGDVSSGNFDTNGTYVPNDVHPDYWLFPTSYYLSAILWAVERKFSKIYVLCESFENPTCETIVKLATFVPTIVVRHNQALLDDLHILLCADEVAVSQGTFKNVLLFTAKPPTVHVFSKVAVSSCNYKQVRYFIADEAERNSFETEIAGGWKNTAWHRHLVDKHYNITTCNK